MKILRVVEVNHEVDLIVYEGLDGSELKAYMAKGHELKPDDEIDLVVHKRKKP